MTTHVKLGAKKDGTLTAHPGARRVQHRRLRQSWRRDAGRRARQPDRRLSLPQQEGRRLRGLHQHGAGRRVSRLWRLANHLRHRMRHRRSGEAARHRPVRDQAHQQGRARPTASSRSGRTPPTSMFGSYGIDQCLDLVETALEERHGDCPSPKATTGWRGPASALAMLEFGPADRAPLGRRDAAAGRRHLSSRGRLDRDGQRLDHLASPDRRVGAQHARRAASPSSTATPTRRPTTPAPSPAPERWWRGRRSRRPRWRCATTSSTLPAAISAAMPADCRLQDDAIICANRKIPLAELYAAGAKVGDRFDVEPQGLSVAALGRLQRAGRARRRASRHRRDHDLAERARRRYRQADQSDAVPRPDRRRHRHGLRLGALREDGLSTTTARW